MNNRIDQLFQNKLNNHSVAPSAEAWKTVHAKTNKSFATIIWRAAAVLLLATTLFGVWKYNNRIDSSTLVAGKTPQIKSQSTSSENEINKNESRHASTMDEKKENQPKQVTSTQTEALNQDIVENDEVAQVVATENKFNETKNEVIQPTEATVVTEIASTIQEAIVIEFSLPALTDVAPEEVLSETEDEKSNGLKKIWNAARDAKNGETGFSLREMKDELLAFEFKKDKTKRN